MTQVLKIAAYVLITVVLGFLLRELGFKGAKLVILIGTVSVIGASALTFGEILSSLPGMEGAGREYTVAMMKIIGVGYVFGICSDVCCELGEGGLGNAVMMLGRVEIIALSLPFIKRIVEKGIELL